MNTASVRRLWGMMQGQRQHCKTYQRKSATARQMRPRTGGERTYEKLAVVQEM